MNVRGVDEKWMNEEWMDEWNVVNFCSSRKMWAGSPQKAGNRKKQGAEVNTKQSRPLLKTAHLQVKNHQSTSG